MKKPSVVAELIKLIGIAFVGWVLWVFIFAMFTPEAADDVREPFRGASLFFGILTGLVLFLGLKFNSTNRQYQATKSAKSNIQVVEEYSNALLEKANKVADKYMDYEKEVVIEAVQIQSSSREKRWKFSNSLEFKSALVNYPELKANEAIMSLLEQLESSERNLAIEKKTYNKLVEEYNSTIYSFPISIVRSLFKFEEAEFYKEYQIPSENSLDF